MRSSTAAQPDMELMIQGPVPSGRVIVTILESVFFFKSFSRHPRIHPFSQSAVSVRLTNVRKRKSVGTWWK